MQVRSGEKDEEDGINLVVVCSSSITGVIGGTRLDVDVTSLVELRSVVETFALI